MSLQNPAVKTATLKEKVLSQQSKFAEFKAEQASALEEPLLVQNTVHSGNNEERTYAVSEDGTVIMEISCHGQDNNHYAGDNRIKKVIVPSGIRKIKHNQFKECKSLHIVIVRSESHLKNIGCKAFYKCRSLKNVVFEDETLNLHSIGESAFQDCTSLTRFFPCKIIASRHGIFEINKYAFSGCKSLRSFHLNLDLPEELCLDIPSLSLVIDEEAFFHCTSLEYVKFCYTGDIDPEIPILTSPNMYLNRAIFQGCRNLSKFNLERFFVQPILFLQAFTGEYGPFYVPALGGAYNLIDIFTGCPYLLTWNTNLLSILNVLSLISYILADSVRQNGDIPVLP